jgi:chorismate mutase
VHDVEALRAGIDAADEAILRNLAERRRVAAELARAKARLGAPALDPARETELAARWRESARSLGSSEQLASAVLEAVLADSRALVTREWEDERARILRTEEP